LTTQRRQIHKFADEQARRAGWNPIEARKRLDAAITRRGFAWFQALKDERNRLRLNHAARKRRRAGSNVLDIDTAGRRWRREQMQDSVDGLDLDVADEGDAWAWLYYH
jgi:hypothetical protein